MTKLITELGIFYISDDLDVNDEGKLYNIYSGEILDNGT